MVPYDCANGSSVWFYLWGVDAVLGNGYGIWGQNYDGLLQESEM